MEEILIDIDLSEIDINETANDSFDIEQGIEEAKVKLVDICIEEKALQEIRFEDDIWVFEDPLKKSKLFIKFDDIESKVNFNKNIDIENFKNVIKCWVIQLYDNHYSLVVRSCLNNLKKLIKLTSGFKKELAEVLKQHLTESTHSDVHKAKMIDIMHNFFDFAQIDTASHYSETLKSLYNNLSRDYRVRKIPSSKDVLTFSKKLEEWFDEVRREGREEELLTYYPIMLWYKLTTIIPIRPSEFCAIKRDAIKSLDGKSYLKLPRKKNKKTANVQIVDEFLISEELANLINDYINISNSYGETDTLISYRAIRGGKRRTQKKQKLFYIKNILSFIALFL